MSYKYSEDKKAYHKEYHKKWYQNNKDKVIAKQKARRQEIKEWYTKYKETLKCKNCGFSHPAAIDFHHIDGNNKEFEVNRLYSNKSSIQKIKKEIDKCMPLCANCHRILHWEENKLIP